MFRALPLLALLAAPAHAQSQCGAIPDALAQLYGAGFVAVNVGQVEGGSFTVFTHPDGSFLVIWMDGAQACVVAHGMKWEAVKPNA